VTETFHEAERRRALRGAGPARDPAFWGSTLLQGLMARLGHAEEHGEPLRTAREAVGRDGRTSHQDIGSAFRARATMVG
jgi:hypothetical protein